MRHTGIVRRAIPALLLLLLYGSLSAQEKKPFPMRPVGDEAFGIIRLFYEYDRDIPLEARVVETAKMDNCTREKIVFRGVRDCPVPGYLALPKTGPPPYPVIILLHGHTGNKGEWWRDDSYYHGGLVTKAYLPAGYAVLALDAQYHGERSVHNGYESPRLLHERRWYNRSTDMIIQSVRDYRRAIDYLETRDDIDAKRIGVHGYSMGGMMAFLLTGVEPRVKAAVSHVTWNWDVETPKYQAIAPHNFARAVRNRPFLMQMGRQDPVLPGEAARRLYDLVESPSTKLIFHDSGHRLPDVYIDNSLAWFREHL